MIEQAKFTYSLLGSFEKTNKNNLRPRKKEVETLEVLEPEEQEPFPKDLFPKDLEKNKIKN